MATCSSIFAWKIPRTEEPGGLQSTGPQRVGHDLVTIQQEFSPYTEDYRISHWGLGLHLIIKKNIYIYIYIFI